ncbi:MAG: dipeptide epimerase [Thermoprotei archaeon]|nr:MAG: dipeptide epimerase [Thermoprotei archaeon]
MKIKKISVYSFNVKLRSPFRIALGTSITSSGYLVRIETKDGLIGFGEASPSSKILGDDMKSCLETLRSLANELVGSDIKSMEELERRIAKVGGSPSARCAISMALWDLWARIHNEPLYVLLGGARDRVETDYTIGIKGIKETVEEALSLVKMGFRTLKIKVGEDPKKDVERLKAVRDAVGDKVNIRIDANQGWTYEEALWVINQIKDLDIQLIEQPLPANDLRGLAKLKARSEIPIMLDESVHNAYDALIALKLNACDVINIKLMKAASIREALKIAYIAEAAEIPTMIGCMAELQVGILAGINFACGLNVVKYVDLDADLMAEQRLVSVNTIEIPYRFPLRSPGLGFEDKDINYDLLSKEVEVTKD